MARRRIVSIAWPLWLILLAAQALLSCLVEGEGGNQTVRIVGWIVGMSAGILAVWPMLDLHRKGSPTQRRDYTQTTRLVQTGIYSVVRHPQYLSFILFSIWLGLIVQHWLVFVLGAAAIGTVCVGIVPQADRDNVAKFGSAYESYMQKVPALNPLLGVLRLLRRASGQEER